MVQVTARLPREDAPKVTIATFPNGITLEQFHALVCRLVMRGLHDIRLEPVHTETVQ